MKTQNRQRYFVVLRARTDEDRRLASTPPRTTPAAASRLNGRGVGALLLLLLLLLLARGGDLTAWHNGRRTLAVSEASWLIAGC
jgi:hypothetical protein